MRPTFSKVLVLKNGGGGGSEDEAKLMGAVVLTVSKT